MVSCYTNVGGSVSFIVWFIVYGIFDDIVICFV